MRINFSLPLDDKELKKAIIAYVRKTLKRKLKSKHKIKKIKIESIEGLVTGYYIVK